MGEKVINADCLFGASYMLRQVEAMQGELQGALVGEDIEKIHQMRVASRRMRNALELFRDCLSKKDVKNWRKEVRKITKALGNARDLDIQIDLITRCCEHELDDTIKPGYNRLLLRLTQRRVLAQDKVNRALERLRQRGILEMLQKRLRTMTPGKENVYLFSPSLYERAFNTISKDLESFLSYEGEIYDPAKKEELHAMRIAGKHLRYSMEVFAPIYRNALDEHIRAMKDLQDTLGDIHDNDVWIDWLPKFIEDEQGRIEDYYGNAAPIKRLLPGFNHFLDERHRHREQQYFAFLSSWETLKGESAWSNLEKIIKAPIDIESALAHLAPDLECLHDREESTGQVSSRENIEGDSGASTQIEPPERRDTTNDPKNTI